MKVAKMAGDGTNNTHDVDIKILDKPDFCNFLEKRDKGLSLVDKLTEQIQLLESGIKDYRNINSGHYQEPVQKTIDAMNSLIDVMDNARIQIHIDLDDEYYNIGIDSLTELLCGLKVAGYITPTEYQQDDLINERWFYHFEEIKTIRIKKLENLITWEEMDAAIDAVLQKPVILKMSELKTLCKNIGGDK